MKYLVKESGTKLWLSSQDTLNWAECWPCSRLRGRRVFAEFAKNGDLIDLAVDGKSAPDDLEGNELSACTQDFLDEVGRLQGRDGCK